MSDRPESGWQPEPITLTPIGVVRGGRESSDDDHWGGFQSRIELDPRRFDETSLAALDSFSHVIVVFHFHLVDPGADLTVTVEGLDAMDGTPVLDLKPHMAEFEPRGDVEQPDWSHELMTDYFSSAPDPGI